MTNTNETSKTKRFYADHHDQIFEKRVNSSFPVRRRVHAEIYESILRHIEPGMTVLDAGCGEGALSMLMAERGARVIAIDYSAPNIEAARKFAANRAIAPDQVTFLIGDSEKLPFPNSSFDMVISNHVLEHLPHFDGGIAELHRVTNGRALIAVPTCLNPCSWSLLGGAPYWHLGKRAILAFPFGLLRVIWAFLSSADGVDEGYGDSADTVHVFRFPRAVARALRMAGFTISRYEAQSLCLPYLDIKAGFDPGARVIRNLGIGTLFHVKKSVP